MGILGGLDAHFLHAFVKAHRERPAVLAPFTLGGLSSEENQLWIMQMLFSDMTQKKCKCVALFIYLLCSSATKLSHSHGQALSNDVRAIPHRVSEIVDKRRPLNPLKV